MAYVPSPIFLSGGGCQCQKVQAVCVRENDGACLPLEYFFLISSFRSSASSGPAFRGAEAIGFLGRGAFSLKPVCRLDLAVPRGREGPRPAIAAFDRDE